MLNDYFSQVALIVLLNRECWFFCSAGFEKRQAELLVSALVTLTTANTDIIYKDMVTKGHQVGGL